MFFLLRPSRQVIERFIDASQELPLSYSRVGLVRDGSAGRDFDEYGTGDRHHTNHFGFAYGTLTNHARRTPSNPNEQ